MNNSWTNVSFCWNTCVFRHEHHITYKALFMDTSPLLPDSVCLFSIATYNHHEPVKRFLAPQRLQNVFSKSDSCCELHAPFWSVSGISGWSPHWERYIHCTWITNTPDIMPLTLTRSSGPRVELTRRCYTFTSLTFEDGGPVGLPNHRVLQTHRAAATLLLRLISVYVSHTHPASPSPRPGRVGADSPLGVVLAGLEGEWLSWVYECDVQDFPALCAVWGEDAWRVNPELDQQVWLEGWSHPGVVQVWSGRMNGNIFITHRKLTALCATTWPI